ncbi:1f3d4e3a-b56d-4fd1-a0e1-481fe67ab24e [Sclerotinia trifoliorum]|uniref:Calmodulin n=1 Tax=Sclerotinia trifoliorum TaxID=28548 RepID=A0A8H2ZSN9_9HELO|nr:1f3d4e3a-b56d-4fd1-a0e1-481fe67ab24e [Sclerotinia trifoliorum]
MAELKNAQGLSNEEIQAYRDAFSIFDKDGDGTISTAELAEAMKSLGQNPSDAEIQDMINEVDVDQSGTVDFDEFLKMMTTETKGVDFEQEMRSAFKVFDVDGSGTISPEEIYKLMASLGENLSEEEIKSMVKEVDKNGDGSIDYDEFVSFIRDNK